MLRLLVLLSLFVGLPARAEAPRVVTDIAPVHSLVAMVMEGVGTPSLLLDPGTSPHSYAMRPSEAAALERADVVVWIGPALTPWLERPLHNIAGRARVLTLLDIAPVQIKIEGHHEDEAHHDDDGHDDKKAEKEQQAEGSDGQNRPQNGAHRVLLEISTPHVAHQRPRASWVSHGLMLLQF